MADPTPTKMEDDESDIEMEGMDMNDDEDAVDEDAADNEETEAPEEEVKVDEHELEELEAARKERMDLMCVYFILELLFGVLVSYWLHTYHLTRNVPFITSSS